MAAFAKSWRRDVLINAQIAAGYARLVAVASPLVLSTGTSGYGCPKKRN
jgi:hypothetical protein